MLYEGNFRINDHEAKLKELDYDIVELIRRNEAGLLPNLLEGKRIIPFLVSHVSERELELTRKPVVALPMGGDCFYCLTDPESKYGICGGFLFDEGKLYFAPRLVNLAYDRDSFRQVPNLLFGNYFTDMDFRAVIQAFADAKIQLFRTIDEVVYYDKRWGWPDGKIPRLKEMSYGEAFRELKA
jgi:hypothetical protein